MASPVVEEVVEATLAAAAGQARPVAVAAVVVAKAEVGVVVEVAEPVRAGVVLVQHPGRAAAERAPQVWAGSLFSLPPGRR